MNILLISDSYHPVVSGVTHVVSSYAKQLAGMGHTVTILAVNTRFRTCIEHTNGYTVYRTAGFKNSIRPDVYIPVPHISHILTYVQRNKPDCIHIHSPGILGLTGIYIGHMLNIPIIATSHGIPSFIINYLPLVPFSRPFLRVLKYLIWRYIRWFFQFADLILAPSQFIKRGLRANGVTRRIAILPMWIENTTESWPKSQKLQDKNKHPFIDFLYIGRLDPDKNIPFLMRAWMKSKAYPENARNRLLIAGRGSNQRQLRKLAHRDTSNSISFIGFIPYTQSTSLFASVAYVMTPGLNETQSITTLQAIKAGKQVIIAKRGALIEIARRFPGYTVMYKSKDILDLVHCITTIASRPKPSKKPDFSFYDKKRIVPLLVSFYADAARR